MTLPAGLLASSLLRWVLLRAARAGGEVRCDMRSALKLSLAVFGALSLPGCPKPPPDPVPADECKKQGQACADNPATEGPPPVGSNVPPKT
jgi:hypothetical protein